MQSKVLICSPPPTVSGGIARWSKNIFNHFNNLRNSEVTLILFAIKREHFVDPSTSLFNRLKYGIQDYKSIIKKYKITIKKDKPDIVHITTSASYGLFKDIIMQRIARRYKIKNVIHFRFGRIPELKEKNNWEWYLLNYLIKKTNAAIVIDDQSYKTLLKAGHNNVSLLPNPISSDLLRTIDKFKDIKRGNWNILFAGHIIKTKGIFELVKACVNIPGITLKMMGAMQPGIKEQLLGLAQKKGNLDWIELMPNQGSDVVIKEMLSAAVFALPSYTEGFPNVILESMACGCPIVASTVGGIPEMLDCGSGEEAGICILPQDVNALQIAIERMLEDKKFAKKCGANARRRVKEKYDMPIVWNQLTSIWKKVLGGKLALN